jgi:hypothetical protein
VAAQAQQAAQQQAQAAAQAQQQVGLGQIVTDPSLPAPDLYRLAHGHSVPVLTTSPPRYRASFLDLYVIL